MTSTPLAGERLRPLGHLSVAPLDKEKRRHNQQAGARIAEKTADQPDLAPREAILRRQLGATTRLCAAFVSSHRRIRPDSRPRGPQWLMRTFGVRPNRVICATTSGDSVRMGLSPIRSWLNAAAAWVKVWFEGAARCASFSVSGDGAGNAVLQQKIPRPVF